MGSMSTGRKWWSWGMRVVPPCGRGQLCGLRWSVALPPRVRWKACPWAVGWWRVAGGGRPLFGGPVGRSGRQRCVGQAWGCSLCLLVSAWLGSCNAGRRARQRPQGETVRVGYIPGWGGRVWGFGAMCGGRVWVFGRCGCAVGLRALRGGCVWGCQMFGSARRAWQEGLWRVCVGVRGGGGGLCCGARGCTRCWACVGHWVGTAKGGVGGVRSGSRAVCRCTCPLAAVCICGHV